MIYQHRHPDHQEDIVIGADPAEGNDWSAWVAISKQRADVVMIGRSKCESSQLGHELNHIGRWFHKQTTLFPVIAPERNVGAATIYVLKELNYPQLYRGTDSFVKQTELAGTQYGWHTNTATRPKMLDDLALAVRQKAITLPSTVLIDEMYTFIRNEKTGKPEAEVGCNDDLVMSLAIAWQLYSVVPTQIDTTNYKYEGSKWKIGK